MFVVNHSYALKLGLLFCLSLLMACHPETELPQPYDEDAETLDQIDDSSETNPISTSYRPPSDDNTEIVEVPITGINLGWGWDHHNAAPVRTQCVEYIEASEPAQTRYMTMKEVSDSYELMQSMGMSAQASVKTIAFEAKGKAAFAKDTNITGYSSNFVLNATVENGVRYTAPAESGAVRLTDQAVILAANDLDEFEHQCGDAYVSAVYSGAKLTALITIETKSQEEKQEMSATMSGSGWGAEFEASMKQKTGSKTENKNMSVSIFQTGGRGDGIPKNKQDLLDKLDVLPAIAFDAPKDFHIAVTPYDTLANWPAQTLDTSEDEFEQLASYWGAYNTLYDEIQYILDHPSEFASPVVTEDTCTFSSTMPLQTSQVARLERVQDDILDALHRIENFARYCTQEEEGCRFPEDIFRNPYAYRVQLPLEIHLANAALDKASPDDIPADVKKNMETTRQSLEYVYKLCQPKQSLAKALGYCALIKDMLDQVTPAAKTYQYDIELLAQNTIIDLTKRRCQNDKTDPLCLSNAEIDQWQDKMSYQLSKYDDLEQRDAMLDQLMKLELTRSFESCAGDSNTSKALFSAEPGFPAIWYHPSIKSCVLNKVDSCTELAQTEIIAPEKATEEE